MKPKEQTEEEIQEIIDHKINKTKNKLTLKEMKEAIIEIEKNNASEAKFSTFGLFILIFIVICAVIYFITQ